MQNIANTFLKLQFQDKNLEFKARKTVDPTNTVKYDICLATFPVISAKIQNSFKKSQKLRIRHFPPPNLFTKSTIKLRTFIIKHDNYSNDFSISYTYYYKSVRVFYLLIFSIKNFNIRSLG